MSLSSKPAKQKEYQLRYQEKYGKQHVANLLRAARRKYGITPDQYAAMLVAQGGVCAICKEPETQVIRGTRYPLAVDHDHRTGKVRGLLCLKCNRGLSLFMDSALILHSASVYLATHSR